MNDKQILTVLTLILVVLTVGFFGSGFLTGLATYQYANTTMNLTVAGFVSITPSAAITWGIRWGSLNPGSNNNMALNDTTGEPVVNCTDYNITVDASSNVNVDLFNNASSNLTYQANTIRIQNVTLESNQTQCGTNVNMTLKTDGTIPLNGTYLIIGNTSTTAGPCKSVPHPGNCYIAYWLDVPSAQVPGDYNTTYNFCGVQENLGSGSC